ncbi:hypothetical protein CACET_c01260 [Clostridium aceticum]|uniref:Uncharacterized protein n=1 Tax=Clostridium aceticum TaxID=84022 RepID=A0A0G3W876_9CLOT|nr:hypothetical protein [Clostridium aceticum]AKL93644.1 hypothetical protein CACET_c01260 [Clostridium aceticum]
MEEKMFLMLEKIYSELQGVKGEVNGLNSEASSLKSEVGSLNSEVSSLKSEVGSLNSEVSSLKSEVSSLKSEVRENSQRLTKLETKVENEVVTKINSLFDGYIQNTETINRVEDKVDHLTEKVEKQELEIRVIKGGK